MPILNKYFDYLRKIIPEDYKARLQKFREHVEWIHKHDADNWYLKNLYLRFLLNKPRYLIPFFKLQKVPDFSHYDNFEVLEEVIITIFQILNENVKIDKELREIYNRCMNRMRKYKTLHAKTIFDC